MAAPTRIDESTLRQTIQQRLRDDGVFDEITARIRSSIVISLCNQNTTITKVNHGLEEMAWRSLIYHFLDDRKLVHTLSIYSAECKLEDKGVMTVDDCLKALSSTNAWLQWKKFDCVNRQECTEEGDIQILLRAVAHWSSSHQHPSTNRQCVSVSVQTDVHLTAAGSCESNKENERGNQHETRKSSEQRVLDIERDLRHEMNEKLRLSAKKQALNATRRLEERHKEDIALMQSKIDAERAKAEAKEREWTEKLALLEKDRQEERKETKRKLERLVLAKDTLESDVGLLHDVNKKKMKEWAVKEDELEQKKRHLQSELNKVHCQQDAIKATELRCIALQEQQDSWLSEREELLDEIKLLREHLASLHKAKDIIQQSLTQLKWEHLATSQKHQIKENLLQRDVSHLQDELQKLDEKYQIAIASVEKTSYEVDSLRSLLKQSQTYLESVTFRDDDNAVPRRHSVGICRSTRGLLPATQSARPTTTSRPCSALGSSYQLGTTSKVLSIKVANDARPNKQHEYPPSRQDDAATSHYLKHPPFESDDDIQCTRDKNNQAIFPEDPPSSFAGDPPGGSSVSDTFKETVHRSQKFGSFRHKPSSPVKAPITCNNHVHSIFQDQPDDVSAISEAVIRDEQSELNEGMVKSSFGQDIEGTDLAQRHDENKSDDLNDCNSMKKYDNPLEPNSTFKDIETQDDRNSAKATDSLVAQKMAEPAGSNMSETKSNYSEESDNQKCLLAEQSDTPRSLASSSSSHAYSASFCTEE